MMEETFRFIEFGETASHFSPLHQAQVIPASSNQQLCTCRRVFDLKTLDFDPYMKI